MGSCALGCKRPGEHFAACQGFGSVDRSLCRGCVPRETVGDSLICGKCFGRTRALLAAAPDLLGHLRTLTDPLKGTSYDREPGGGGARLHAPPPVPVELLDAADFITTLLWSAREVVEGRSPVGKVLVPVSATAAGLLEWADEQVAVIVAGLPALSERAEVVPLVQAVKGRPESRDEWTLRTVAERWSLQEPPWWAAQGCPVCGLRAVKVTPPQVPGDETGYRCASCAWVAPEDVDGFWAEAFSRREGKAA